MTKTKRLTAHGLLVTTALACTACAPLDEAALDARQYRQVDFENRFREYRAQCLAQGGRIYIAASGKVDSDGVPSRGDRYFCS